MTSAPFAPFGGVRSGQFADHRAAVRRLGLDEIDQHRADRQNIAGCAVETRNRTGRGRRQLDHGLVGLDRRQGLVGDHVVADGHVPGHQLGLLQAFAEIRELEAGHR